MRPVTSFLAIVGGAALAQAVGVPLDGPVVRAATAGAFAWAAGRVVRIETEVAWIKATLRKLIGGRDA